MANVLSFTPVFSGFPCGSAGKESTYNLGDLGWEDPLKKGKVTLSSILAYSPWGHKGLETTEQLSLNFKSLVSGEGLHMWQVRNAMKRGVPCVFLLG